VKQQSSGNYGLLDKLTDLINRNFGSITLINAADAFGYHPNYLSSLIKNETGKSFTDLILQIRMERALIMLKNTSLSVNEISDYLGYSNTSNFYKAFKKYYNTSPREIESV